MTSTCQTTVSSVKHATARRGEPITPKEAIIHGAHEEGKCDAREIMTTAKRLRQLVKSGSEGDHQAFRQVSEQLIQEERSKNHHFLANDLEKMVYGRRSANSPLHSVLNDQLPKEKASSRETGCISNPIAVPASIHIMPEQNSFSCATGGVK